MVADMPPLIGESPAFSELLAKVSVLAPVERPLLLIGDRGTGKELVASRLHFLSARWDRPLVKVNCGALSESLLDSELFGHEAGAFTGAVRRRLGRFEQADGGTLFLDEIGNAPLAVQERILRAVEYGEIDRVGGGTVRVDVRVIAATNADLPAAVKTGKFRADLLDRLAFDVVRLPRLRDRPDDIALLAQYFAEAMTKELKRPLFPGFTRQAQDQLLAADWPGNVRELKAVIERSVLHAEDSTRPLGMILLDPFATQHAAAAIEIGLAADGERPPTNFTQQVDQFERGLLEQALRAHRQRQTAAARALGLTYHRFRHLLRKHGLIGDTPSPED